MRVIVIGGRGTIGEAIQTELKKRHEVIAPGHNEVDMLSEDSLDKYFSKVGKFDALVIAAGKLVFQPFSQMNVEKYNFGLNDKLMGQVRGVLVGSKHVIDNGSFTLTSGTLSKDPIVAGSSASMVNAAINGFVIGSAIELGRGLRINAVSPTVITESLKAYGPFFRGYESVSAERAALAYCKSVEGKQTGQVYEVG